MKIERPPPLVKKNPNLLGAAHSPADARSGPKQDMHESGWERDHYLSLSSSPRLAMEHRVELLEENMKRCSHSLAEAKATIAVISNENQALTEK